MITGDDFGRLFQAFEHTAFRLEVRDRYDSPIENEALRKYLAGEPDELDWFQDWLSLIRTATKAGKRFSRVRVVTLPLTDYSRFGVWCAQYTNAAGEDIRYLTRDEADAEGLPNYDYWLFDSRQLVCMHYDEADQFQGAELLEDPAEIVQHNYWRDVAWHRAVRRDDFATE